MGEPAGTVRTDQYLSRFQETFGKPVYAIMLFVLARGVELVYALERARAINLHDADSYLQGREYRWYELVQKVLPRARI
jgi:hypothetical protein